jgi:hypothetical protein
MTITSVQRGPSIKEYPAIRRRSAALQPGFANWLDQLPRDTIRANLMNGSLVGLEGPAFFEGTCLEPILSKDDCGFFEPWSEGMELRDGDIVSFVWGGVWQPFAQAAYGTDMGVKIVRFVDGEPWLVSNELSLPLGDLEILGVLRAIIPRFAVMEVLDAALMYAVKTMSAGTMLMLAAIDMSLSGVISGPGPSDPAEREALLRTGWQPYSVKIGDRWFAYNRLDPIGGTLGLAAGFAEIALNDSDEDIDPADFENALVGSIAAIASNVMSKNYLANISEFFEMMSNPDRYAPSYAADLASTLVPALFAEITRQVDPYMRDANTMLEGMQRRVPGLSDELPLVRDLWGRPISYQSGLGMAYDIFSPIYSKKENPEPIDREILDQGFRIRKPRKDEVFRGVDMKKHAHAYSRFLELSGNELKHPAWGLGAMDLMNQIVAGEHVLSQVYQIRSDGPGGGKEMFLGKLLSDYREIAKQQILEEFPELQREVDLVEAKRRELRMPVLR